MPVFTYVCKVIWSLKYILGTRWLQTGMFNETNWTVNWSKKKILLYKYVWTHLDDKRESWLSCYKYVCTHHFDNLSLWPTFFVFPPNTENFSEEKQKKPFLPTFTCIQEIQEIQEIERSPGLCLQMSSYRPHTWRTSPNLIVFNVKVFWYNLSTKWIQWYTYYWLYWYI